MKLVFADANICVLKIVIDDVCEDLKDLSEHCIWISVTTIQLIQVVTGHVRKCYEILRMSPVKEPLQVARNEEKESKKSKGVTKRKRANT